jgi:hypothetical protein
MAKLVIQSPGFNNQVIYLNLGLNRFGRAPGNDFVIEHATISSKHCEVILTNAEVTVRDRGSTNGTFVNSQPISEARLKPGQILRLGDVDLLVESTEVTISIPQLKVERDAPSVVPIHGALQCARHPRSRVTHQCTHCRETMCDACLSLLRRRGGKLLKLCPLCSHAVEPLGGPKKRKNSFLRFLRSTVKLPFLRNAKEEE